MKNKKKEKSLAATYFPTPKGSIIGVRELDFRVRYGNGYFLSTMTTRHLLLSYPETLSVSCYTEEQVSYKKNITSIQLMRKKINENDNMVKPHDLLVLLD